jgi:GH24 family phage-related lysozyme (muramidase)
MISDVLYNTMKKPSVETLKLLFDYEVGGGKSYYDKYLSRFTWPGGASGPTIGIGVDCGYYTKDELAKIFYFLPAGEIKLIQGASGKTSAAGKEYTKTLREAGIVVSWDQAKEIFETLTWPKFAKLTEKAFPMIDELCDDAYGALVSLVFNRGSSLTGDRRIEMRKIKELVPTKNYKGIAKELRKMKRLWQGKGLDGLIARREAEARLVESCI